MAVMMAVASPEAAERAGAQDGGASSLARPLASSGRCIYLDYNATTPIAREVAARMEPFLWAEFGNPSSSHFFGAPSAAAVREARGEVAAMLGAERALAAEEIVFVSCGTEANNWAISGAVERSARAGGAPPHVVTSSFEHPAVLERLRALEGAGRATWTAVDPGADGIVRPGAVAAALTPRTCLVTVMHSNNEVGTIQPIAEIARAVRAAPHAPAGVLVHTDAAQSCGKVPVRVGELGVDMATVVGHKFGAPKGVGALYIRRGTSLPNFLHGGGQERARRAGTENVLHIVGLGEAAGLVNREGKRITAHLRATRDALRRELERRAGGGPGPRVAIAVNGHPGDERAYAERVLPNTLSVSFPGVSASAVLARIGDRVACSASAACHSECTSISHVLRAMKVPEEVAVGTLRLSTGRHSTEAEMAAAAEVILAAVREEMR